MRDNYFVFAGKNSKEFNLIISRASTWASPEFEVGSTSIPGRNGDLLNKHGRLKNGKYAFKDSAIAGNFSRYFPYLKDWMVSHADRYYRLEDTYNPDSYLLAAFDGSSIEPDYDAYNDAGTFDIQFNVMPQRWLIDGEKETVFNNPTGNVIFNPTMFDARPLITVYGTGTLYINGRGVKIQDNYPYQTITIDCETYDAYKDETNCNNYIQILGSDNEFPVLKGSVESYIEFGNSKISRVEIIPRWWRSL